jgi:hypothetical protein
MNKKISRSIVFLAFTFISSLVFADGPLTIQTSADGCPTGVTSDGSCPAGYPGGAACRDTGAVVRWVSTGNDIEEIYKKPDSAGRLECNGRGPTGYQCVVTGTSGDYIDYNVKLVGCEVFDPTIIIR